MGSIIYLRIDFPRVSAFVDIGHINSLSCSGNSGTCDFMDPNEFADGVDYLREKVVIVGCGSQG